MSEKIVQLNEEVIKGQIKELVRGSVEETLNELLEKEAESLTQAARYERSEARQGYRNCERMAAHIFATAQNGIPVLPNAPSTQIVITEAIRVLHTVEASRDAILTQMQALAKTLPEYSLVREMPCIGDTLAPRLIAEIGDVRRFHSKRALIAYAGIDAPPYQSGKFRANNRHISKRGSRYLRKTGYEVMQSYVMHKPANDPIFTFIEKKRGEGKSGKLAMVAGLNKFLRIYYGKVTELYRSLPAIE